MSGSPPVIETLGCRLNEYESEAIGEIATEQGVTDTVIVNTCAVTAEAVRKSRQAIRRASRNHPGARLVATGCAAQIDMAGFSRMDQVDVLVGNSRKLDQEVWRSMAGPERGRGANPRIIADDIMAVKKPSNHVISTFGKRARAYIQVQNGCDHRCTFCIIPYGRGNSRSVTAREVVVQVRRLADQGYREIVLSGVDLTAWGLDLPGEPRLGQLVSQILAAVPDLPRLRLSSVDVVEIDKELMDVLGSETRLMPHLHLSLQAGHNMILKRMKRRHLREDVIRFCEDLRRRRPDIAFGADLIAGFPTETDTMFESTLALIRECDLAWLHVFPFSQRHGTPAARMPQLDRAAIRARAARLRTAGQVQIDRHLRQWVGRAGMVLMETSRMGRTEQFAEVTFNEDLEVGSIHLTSFAGTDGKRLAGNPVAADCPATMEQ